MSVVKRQKDLLNGNTTIVGFLPYLHVAAEENLKADFILNKLMIAL